MNQDFNYNPHQLLEGHNLYSLYTDNDGVSPYMKNEPLLGVSTGWNPQQQLPLLQENDLASLSLSAEYNYPARDSFPERNRRQFFSNVGSGFGKSTFCLLWIKCLLPNSASFSCQVLSNSSFLLINFIFHVLKDFNQEPVYEAAPDLQTPQDVKPNVCFSEADSSCSLSLFPPVYSTYDSYPNQQEPSWPMMQNDGETYDNHANGYGMESINSNPGSCLWFLNLAFFMFGFMFDGLFYLHYQSSP